MHTLPITLAMLETQHPSLQAMKPSLGVTAALSLCLGLMAQPIWAETPAQAGLKSTDKPPIEAIKKPTDGKGKLPTFTEADKNGDHFVTKEELQNFPYMLQVFDKVDAGKDGKLEQHEYQNLEMETKREGEIS